MSGYAFHPEALAELREIWDYIAAGNVDAADRLADEIFGTLSTLASAPHIGHPRTDLTARPLRFFAVREYLIAYASDEKPLWVVAIVHGRRNPRVIAATLRER